MNSTISRNKRAANILRFITCLLLGFIMVVPFVWMLLASFKTNPELFRKPLQWLPDSFMLDNYVKVFTNIDFARFYLNTIKLTVIITIAQVLTCSLAAFSFSKLRFPGRDAIFFGYLATLMVPWHAIMIPQFMIVRSFGLYDSHLSLIVLQSFSAFGVFLLRQNMLSIPDSLNEAAKIDGANIFQIYWRIIMPLTKSGIATLVILTFNTVWNDYMGPMIYLDSNANKTIQLGLAYFKQQFSADYTAIMAGTVMSVVPIILIYVFAQRYIIDSVAFAGVKG